MPEEQERRRRVLYVEARREARAISADLHDSRVELLHLSAIADDGRWPNGRPALARDREAARSKKARAQAQEQLLLAAYHAALQRIATAEPGSSGSAG